MRTIHQIAIIDSAIADPEACHMKKEMIDCYQVHNTTISKKIGEQVKESHGTIVSNNLLYECTDIRILSVEVLNDNNKGKLYDLINAIEFCIEKEVSLINISLGAVTDSDTAISRLKAVCVKAIERGIVIIAAHSNQSDVKSYPAEFDFILSVSSNQRIKKYCTMNLSTLDVYFSSSTTMDKYRKEYLINSGNSYLCGFVSGLLCSQLERIHNIEDAVNILGEFLKGRLRERLFINPYDSNALKGNISFVCFGNNPFDKMVKASLENIVEISIWEEFVSKPHQNIDILFLGAIELPVDQVIINTIEMMLENEQIKIKRIISFGAILNTNERKRIIQQYGVDFQAIYL